MAIDMQPEELTRILTDCRCIGALSKAKLLCCNDLC
jgi:hypothetical protein